MDAVQLSILDDAYDFPEPVWQLARPDALVVHDAAPGDADTVHRDAPRRAAVRAALVALLDRGLVAMVYDETGEPVRPVAPADRLRLLDDDATWRPGSPVCVTVTAAGERVVDAAFAAGDGPS